MTIWTALHTHYKLGGFIPIVAWAPLLQMYDYPKNPVNKNSPMLLLNGLADLIVPAVPASLKTKAALEPIFPNFEMKLVPGTHISTVNPVTIPTLTKWMCGNTNLQFSSFHPAALAAMALNGGSCASGGDYPGLTDFVGGEFPGFVDFFGKSQLEKQYIHNKTV